MSLVIKNRRVTVQLVDGTSGTPKGAYVQFRGNFSGPWNRGRSEESLEISNDKADSTIHYTVVTDRPIFEPLTVSMGGKLEETYGLPGVMEFLSNPDDESTWSGLSTNLTGVSSLGSVINADATAVTLPTPKDSHRASHLLNVECLFDGASTDYGRKYQGVFFEADQFQWSSDTEGDATWSAEGTVYGAVGKLSALTTIDEIAA